MDLSLHHRAKTLDIIIYPGCKAIEAVAAVHVFEDANTHLKAAGHPAAYDIRLVAPAAGTVPTHTFVTLFASQALSTLNVPDIAIIVGAPDIERALLHSSVVDWCRAASSRVERLVGMCSGSFFLAEAGLLDGKRATTHWSVAPLMQKRYPKTQLEPDSIFVRDGMFWTSAGVSAGVDLAMAMIEDDLGRDLALAVARDLVVYLKRPGGQSQFSVHLHSQMTNHPTIQKIQHWILERLDVDFTISDLSKRAAMSPRNFARVFARETGQGPAEFIEVARIEFARRLLEEPGLSIRAIASRCGFRSDDQLRRAFKRRCGISPVEYRARVERRGNLPQGSTAKFV